jgi:hypothetical protein
MQQPLEPGHLAGVSFMIVAEEMQQAVEGQQLQLAPLAVTRRPRLTPSDAAGDHDVSEHGRRLSGRGSSGARRLVRCGWETQDVGRVIFPAVAPVQRADARIGHNRDVHAAARPSVPAGDAGQPAAESGGRTMPIFIGDADD